LAQHLGVAAVLVGFGAALGWVAPWVVDWGLAQPWLPFKGPLIILGALEGQVGGWLLIVVGAVVGLVVGVLARADTTKIEITARDITFVKGDKKQRFARSQVGTVVLDGSQLVLRDRADVDLIRQKVDGSLPDVASALRSHDWPTEGLELTS
jgi:hypothetical protein